MKMSSFTVLHEWNAVQPSPAHTHTHTHTHTHIDTDTHTHTHTHTHTDTHTHTTTDIDTQTHTHTHTHTCCESGHMGSDHVIGGHPMWPAAGRELMLQLLSKTTHLPRNPQCTDKHTHSGTCWRDPVSTAHYAHDLCSMQHANSAQHGNDPYACNTRRIDYFGLILCSIKPCT